VSDGVGSSDVVQMAYQVAGAYIDKADLDKEGWVLMTRVQNFPNIATQVGWLLTKFIRPVLFLL
jgi:hypothetical protein